MLVCESCMHNLMGKIYSTRGRGHIIGKDGKDLKVLGGHLMWKEKYAPTIEHSMLSQSGQ